MFADDLKNFFIFVSEANIYHRLEDPIDPIVEVHVGAPVLDMPMVSVTVVEVYPDIVLVIVALVTTTIQSEGI